MFYRYLSSQLIPLPHILTIEITSYCNLRCIMCPRTAGFVNTPPDRVIAIEVIERLEPILKWIDGVDLSGLWGEAFLHPDLYLNILERLKRAHAGVRTVSNGTLITDELAGRLVALGLDCLEISVDAARDETYRAIRRGGELERVISGIRAINRYKEKEGRSAPDIRMLFLGMTENIAELPEFIRLAHSLGVNKVVLQAMGEYENVKEKSVALQHKALGRRWLEEARKQAVELGVSIELFPPEQFTEDNAPGTDSPARSVSHHEKKRITTKDCFFPWDRAVITTEGDVLPCCAAPRPLGNLNEQSFEEIWHGKAYSKLRRSLLDGTLPLMCRTCTGTGWKEINRWDNMGSFVKLERNRIRQGLRRSPLLRKLKNALRP